MTPTRALPTVLCWVCAEREARGIGMCRVCGANYDRSAHHVGSIAEAMRWAAERARRFERVRGAKRSLARAARKGETG